jgi:hypothetical protein
MKKLWELSPPEKAHKVENKISQSKKAPGARNKMKSTAHNDKTKVHKKIENKMRTR